jgi:lipoate---protein ligase
VIYVENNSMEAAFSFALEWYLMKELDLGDEIFMFWRTVPTLMIGCYQNAAAEINEAAARERNVPVIRRVSGGGTIYTDPEGWQYSYISRNKPQTEINFKIYMAPIVAALAELGVTATFSDRNDILIDGQKISGNAQYRSGAVTLHHGSILFNTNLEDLAGLLNVSQEKLISKGIQSVRQRVTNVQEHLQHKLTSLEFRDKMLESLIRNASGTYTLSPQDVARVNEIASQKFRKWEWNFGESPKFEITKSNRFAGGKLECNLNIESGRISACKVYGDFFSNGDIELLQKALVGCPYRREDMQAALERAGVEGILFRISLEEMLSCLI